jgi:putative ABC transport system permease protein
VFSGLYPAFFMAGFRPVSAVKNQRDPRSSANLIRKGLVVFQFVISIFMIFCTLVIYKQMEFFRNKDLGFDKESLVAVELYGEMRRSFVKNADALKTELMQYSGISNVAVASDLPGERLSLENLKPEGWPESQSLPIMRYLRVDENYLQTMNIELEEGRDFIKSSSKTPVFIINRAAAEALGLDDPVGKTVIGSMQSDPGRIIGVIKNFHFASLHSDIEPMVLSYRPSWAGYLLVRIREGKAAETLQFLQEKIKEVSPENLFMYSFIDDDLNRLYRSEDKLGDIFKAFSLIAILVSCLGLFGLSAFSAELHIKEIGIRKVLGASVRGITFLLTREFIFWVGLANIFALPAAYFASRHWLQGFAFRTNIGIDVFLLSALLALVIAVFSVSYRAIKAALADPVKALRYE